MGQQSRGKRQEFAATPRGSDATNPTPPRPAIRASPASSGPGSEPAIPELSELRFPLDGLLPVVVQDLRTKQVLMVAFTNAETLAMTIESGEAWFWSRSRGGPWHKGGTSGNVIHVRQMLKNCEDNSLVYLAEPVGPACHTGNQTCFFRQLDAAGQLPLQRHEADEGRAAALTPVGDSPTPSAMETGEARGYADSGDMSTGAAVAQVAPTELREAREAHPAAGPDVLVEVARVIRQRQRKPPPGSYVGYLFEGGWQRIAKKIGEEAAEVIVAAASGRADELAMEMADLWFHTLVLLAERGVDPASVYAQLALRRRGEGEPSESAGV